MSLKLKNTWIKVGGKDRWEWSAFVDDEGSGELDKIDYVEYVLHPTFPNPRRQIRNPNNGFEMKTEGWGEFQLVAFANLKDGSKTRLTHTVVLKSDPPKGISAKSSIQGFAGRYKP
ncbi:MAG TPA: pYEATS domain-containing protein [Gammaproteobacteria bacterium]|jgi:transcription initiation factor IIF auxiliary subunit